MEYDTHRAFFWRVEASFEESERKQVRVRTLITRNPKSEVRNVKASDVHSILRELQRLTAYANDGMGTFSKLGGAYARVDTSEMLDLPSKVGLEVVLHQEFIYPEKSTYPADIQAWVQGFNATFHDILKNADLVPENQ